VTTCECGHKVHWDARYCPGCGNPDPRGVDARIEASIEKEYSENLKRRTSTLALGLGLLILIIGVIVLSHTP
jgi:hypothetical protein